MKPTPGKKALEAQTGMSMLLLIDEEKRHAAQLIELHKNKTFDFWWYALKLLRQGALLLQFYTIHTFRLLFSMGINTLF